MNRILPAAFTRDAAKIAGISITEIAEKATSSRDDLVGEIKEFIARKGYDATDWEHIACLRCFGGNV